MLAAGTAMCAILSSAALVTAAGMKDELPAVMDPSKDAPGLAVGAKAPDAALVDDEGKAVRLSELYAKGPVVVTFYRGGWCPYCNTALAAWEQEIAELQEMGATLLAISPETADHAAETAEKNKASFAVLCDADREAMRRFKVAFELSPELQEKHNVYGVDLSLRNVDGSWELPAPATFVIDRQGVIRWTHADWDYRKRPEPDAVTAALKGL